MAAECVKLHPLRRIGRRDKARRTRSEAHIGGGVVIHAEEIARLRDELGVGHAVGGKDLLAGSVDLGGAPGQVKTEKRGAAQAGETVALGKLDHARTGDTLTTGKQSIAPLAEVKSHPPVLALGFGAKERKGRDESAGADSRHNLKLRASTARRPAVEEAGTISAIVASSGYSQIAGGRQLT